MKLAVTYENGEIFQHFGHTEYFKVYDVENGKVVASTVLSTQGSGGHGALAGFLAEHSVDVLLCGGIGGGAKHALDLAGIKLCGGISGSADQAVQDYLAGKLDFDPNVLCTLHGEHHGDCGEHHDGHSCGHHCG